MCVFVCVKSLIPWYLNSTSLSALQYITHFQLTASYYVMFGTKVFSNWLFTLKILQNLAYKLVKEIQLAFGPQLIYKDMKIHPCASCRSFVKCSVLRI